MIEGLTKRRQQFLDMIIDLYQKTKLPIHYETLGKALGVSKWTAYDMMKEIEKLGFIKRSYVMNKKETGRSQVMFTPTVKAFDLFRRPRGQHAVPNQWQQTVVELSRSLEKTGADLPNDVIQRLIAKSVHADNQFDFCSSILALFVAYLKQSGKRTEDMIGRLIRTAPRQSHLPLFVGTVFGMVLQSMQEKIDVEMGEMLSRFLRIVEHLSEQEKEKMTDFLIGVI